MRSVSAERGKILHETDGKFFGLRDHSLYFNEWCLDLVYGTVSYSNFIVGFLKIPF